MTPLLKSTPAQLFALIVIICFVLLCVVGMVAFPYAPIRQQGATFVDKLGHMHTADYYRRFLLWERSFIIVGSVFALTAIWSTIRRYFDTGRLWIRPKP